jgi:hypothetical protein
MCQHNDKNYIDGEKGHTELVSSSLKLIAGEIGKRRQFFRLLAELKPYFYTLIIQHHLDLSHIILASCAKQ